MGCARLFIFLFKTRSDAARLAEIARQQKCRKSFWRKLFKILIRGGLIKSKRGACGGYTLARSPDEISFYEVIEALEGPIAVNACMDEHLSCDQLPRCSMVNVWSEIQREVTEVFTSTTIADLKSNPCRDLERLLLSQARRDRLEIVWHRKAGRILKGGGFYEL